MNKKNKTNTHIALFLDEMLQSQRQRTNNDLQNTMYRKLNIQQHEPHYKPAVYMTRLNLHERNHVSELQLWDEPDVRKISMSMDRVGTLCILQLTHQ